MPDSMHTETTKTQTKYWIAFTKIKGVGPQTFFKLLNYFSNLEEAWKTNNADLIAAGIKESLAQEIIIEKNKIDPDAELEILGKEKVGVILYNDEDYPPLLKQIYSPPPLIFYRGDFNCLKKNCLAIVGARKNTFYGQQTLEKLIPTLINYNLTIVSGLAIGVDCIAHQFCLKNNGTTAGVLGSGVDKNSVYPVSNRQIGEKIIDSGGCLLSEYGPGTMPNKQSFPLRNRIISGLSLGTLIIEAGETSGSLITAKYAVEQNREVFSIPGNIFSSQSKGTNNLIKQGAKLVNSADDILDELNIAQISQIKEEKGKVNLSAEEKLIMDLMSHEPIHIDKISQLCRIKINALLSLMITMELKGIIKDAGGQNYIKNLS
ncbi:MAG: DNA-processing protein DprA [Candidatus Buchananbacteria bacterium]